MPSLTLPCAHCGRTTPHRRKGFGFRAKRRVQQYQCGVCGTIQTEKRKEVARWLNANTTTGDNAD